MKYFIHTLECILLVATLTGDYGHQMKPVITDYTLIKEIGSGSYGEVWLARNLTGSYVAIKIVCRVRFSVEADFLREFEGIRCYEPVSRSHPGLVAILHVGQIPDQDAFYYVMELADDASGGPCSDAIHYQPDTLSHRMQGNPQMSVAECASLLSLIGSGLAHIHEKRLIHRDVKPSNIVYVNAMPKLSDPGLVAVSGGASSYVGTVGYVPPEGPGTMRADLFALGMVSYQVLTGNDRHAFPSIPSMLISDSNRCLFVQINRIILKVCSRNPADSYKNTKCFIEDLAQISNAEDSSNSIFKGSRLTVIAMAALSLITAVAMFFWPMAGQATLEDESNVENPGDGIELDFYILTTNQNHIWISRDASSFIRTELQ